MGKKLVMRKGTRIYIRDRLGQFANAPDTGLNPQMGNANKKTLVEIRNEARHTLEELAVPRMKTAYSEENFRKLFGEWGRVDTPAGRVTVPYSQFDKLAKTDKNGKDRKGWLGAMYQTITDPVLIIQENPEKKLFVKTFTPEKKGIITFLSVVFEEKQNRVAVSTHEKDINNIVNKIKNAGSIVFRKTLPTGGGSLTIGKSLRGVLPAGVEMGNLIPHLSTLSSKPLRKSMPRLVIRKSAATAILRGMGGRL